LHTIPFLFVVSISTLLIGCARLQNDQQSFADISDCPQQATVIQAANQGQFSPLSDTPILQCALTVIRHAQDSAFRHDLLGSRLCLYLAEREAIQEKREKLAAEGVVFAESALAHGGDHEGAVHYYLAANLGLAVREHITLAMKNIDRLENEMKRALILSPDIDEGGPLRLLGALYLKAPAWPNGIGDRDKALQLLEKVVKAHPGHPLNHLFYAQALWEEGDQAVTQVKAEFALGERLLTESDWGYSKAPWKKEFDEFKKEFEEAGSTPQQMFPQTLK
jgi:tetratricopeptide (TPR) repeat protein